MRAGTRRLCRARQRLQPLGPGLPQGGRCRLFRGSGGRRAAFRVRSQGLAPCTACSGLGELPEQIFRFSSPLGSNPVRQLPTSAQVRGGGREGDLELCQDAAAGTHMLHGHREGRGQGRDGTGALLTAEGRPRAHGGRAGRQAEAHCFLTVTADTRGREEKTAIPGEITARKKAGGWNGEGAEAGACGHMALPRRTDREYNPHRPEEGRGHGD